MLQAGEVLLDRYKILGEIGRGGMSVVYQARDLSTNRILAIKDVQKDGKKNNQIVEQSLAAEGRMLMQLSNPHLPRIYDIIEDESKIMLVMDYVKGESLDKFIARTGPQNVDLVLNWGMQICEVFHYLHSQVPPIIYRDMKPANVILQPDGKLVLIDFGTARTQKSNDNMLADTICIGTEGFAAPEQYGGYGESRAWTDIYCLGATLYNMVTGQRPCGGPSGIPPLGAVLPELGATPIAEIIEKCTRNDPAERYHTAMELYADLQLASTGAYKTASKRGFASFSGNLKKTDWQRQSGNGGGLSGLLQGLTGQTKNADQPPEKKNYASEKLDGWQVNHPQPAAKQEYTLHPIRQEAEESHLPEEWIQIGVLIAIIFVVLAAVLLALKKTGAAIVFLTVAVAAAVIAAVLLVLSRREQ